MARNSQIFEYERTEPGEERTKAQRIARIIVAAFTITWVTIVCGLMAAAAWSALLRGP